MKALSGLFRLTRPVNMLICALSVISAALLSCKPLSVAATLLSDISALTYNSAGIRVLSAALSAALILAAGNVFNDVCDLETDRINAPHRPIVSGAVSVGLATLFAIALTIAGLILAYTLSISVMALAACAALLLFLYDIRLKGRPLLGNITVAFLGGIAFIYGGIAGDCVTQSFVPAVFAVLLHLGRELIKDVLDYEGDLAAGIRTVATVSGTHSACRIASFALSLLAIATLAPYALGYFGKSYIGIIALTVWPPLGYAMRAALKFPTQDALNRASLLLKVAMPAGLLAVLVGFQGI